MMVRIVLIQQPELEVVQQLPVIVSGGGSGPQFQDPVGQLQRGRVKKTSIGALRCGIVHLVVHFQGLLDILIAADCHILQKLVA